MRQRQSANLSRAQHVGARPVAAPTVPCAQASPDGIAALHRLRGGAVPRPGRGAGLAIDEVPGRDAHGPHGRAGRERSRWRSTGGGTAYSISRRDRIFLLPGASAACPSRCSTRAKSGGRRGGRSGSRSESRASRAEATTPRGCRPRRSLGERASTSVFDPVLCERAYRTWGTRHSAILDPFAGGSVRGIGGRRSGPGIYTGIELRAEQVAANRVQARRLSSNPLRQPPRWILGDALEELARLKRAGLRFDMVFSCPPYGRKERYSNLEADLSTMREEEFDRALGDAVRLSTELLEEDRFSVWVIGDDRHYRRHTPRSPRPADRGRGSRRYEALRRGSLRHRVGSPRSPAPGMSPSASCHGRTSGCSSSSRAARSGPPVGIGPGTGGPTTTVPSLRRPPSCFRATLACWARHSVGGLEELGGPGMAGAEWTLPGGTAGWRSGRVPLAHRSDRPPDPIRWSATESVGRLEHGRESVRVLSASGSSGRPERASATAPRPAGTPPTTPPAGRRPRSRRSPIGVGHRSSAARSAATRSGGQTDARRAGRGGIATDGRMPASRRRRGGGG